MISTSPSLQTVTINGEKDWLREIWSNQDELFLLCNEHQFDIIYSGKRQMMISKKAFQKGTPTDAISRFDDMINGRKSEYSKVV